jgi:hypothetical protein
MSKSKNRLRECCNCCLAHDVGCPVEDCRQWIAYEEDNNCTLIAVQKNGAMTLREIGDRIGVSFVRVKQIESEILKKLDKKFPDLKKQLLK